MVNAIIVKNIDNYCNENKMSRAELERKCGLANGIIGHWARNEFSAGTNTLSRIADYTKIPLYVWFKEGGV